MKTRVILLLTAFALPVLAQQKEAPPLAPAPLEDALWASLVGEWTGWSEDVRGRSEVKLEVEWELQKQFIKTKAESKNPNGIYKIAGYATKDAQSGAISSVWFDSFRGVYRGSETRSGNAFTLKLEGPSTIERTFELVGNDKLVGSYKIVRPSGEVIEGKSELLRKVKAQKKS